jgi:predicted AlkP superfamily pyrophosphatase or phosphodiesterase
MLHLRALAILFAVAIALSRGEPGFANEKVRAKRHVVVIVWDGMRPDFVSEENTPGLWKLAHEGVIF